ncbi:hypothetical protein ACIQUG_21245 [Ensifer sp. NPDC090286]|uniref:hypothetical protein n=1 Tax=Ensifer sp. NPDC090286 TaxID=3363991 RepID=UPI00383A1E69
MVDLEIIERHLALNQSHIDQASRHISKQHLIIEQLEEVGISTRVARDLLETFEANFATHKQERARLLEERELARRGTA